MKPSIWSDELFLMSNSSLNHFYGVTPTALLTSWYIETTNNGWTFVRFWLCWSKSVLNKADFCDSQISSVTCSFYFTLQTEKKTLATHRDEWINAASPTYVDNGTHVQEISSYLHMYTKDYAQKIHNMSHMYNGHTKTAQHRAFPDVTLPQRTKQEKGFSGMMMWNCGSLDRTISMSIKTSPLTFNF